MLRKDIQHIWRQNERSYRGFGLGLCDLGLCALPDHLPSDVELACREVDVLPLKPEYLPSAHTRGQFEEEELVIKAFRNFYAAALALICSITLRIPLHTERSANTSTILPLSVNGASCRTDISFITPFRTIYSMI